MLSEVECLVQAYLWETTTELPLAIPDHAMDASLAIPPSAIEIGAFDLLEPIEVMIDASRTQVLVQLEPIGDETRWARLSDGCYALVNDTYLAGFLVVLRSPQEPPDEALAAALEGPSGDEDHPGTRRRSGGENRALSAPLPPPEGGAGGPTDEMR